MKYLSNYIEEKQTDLFNKLGIFFAFGDKQFNEQKKEGVEYVGLGISGMCCPKENAKQFLDEHTKIVEQGIQQDIKENGIEKVIERELANHEAYYTGEVDDTIDALSEYNIPREKIVEVYRNTRENHDD